MPPTPAAADGGARQVEVACDESGSEGEKLVGGTTDVFAHASIDVAADVAVAWLDEVRLRARSPADEVKASVVLRDQNRALLRDLLGPDGPYAARGALVHLTEKRLLLVRRLVALLGGGDEADALAVHRASGPGSAGWDGLLTTFNDLMRAKYLEDARIHSASLRDRAAALARSLAGTTAGAVLVRIAAHAPATDAALLDLLDRTREDAVLDPLAPAVAAAVAHWGADGSGVLVVHDENRTLREAGLDRLASLCGPGAALAGIRFVDSRDDARVQLADFLAGAARRLASHALAGRPDEELLGLVRPFVSSESVWDGASSGQLLAPRARARP